METPQHSAKVLVLFSHPALHKSRVNRVMAASAKQVPGVTFQDLYAEYPDLDIDVSEQKRLLEAHDVVVHQHPFYWYSAPAIVKEWCDLVLEYGYAYGPGGTALEGKRWAHAITAAGPQDAYRTDGANRFTIRQLLSPFDQTAHLCGMEFLEPFVVHGVLRLDTEKEIPAAAERYAAWLQRLTSLPGAARLGAERTDGAASVSPGARP
jgi:glutathione-regulated potassium-efflux system ancillary protein KefG